MKRLMAALALSATALVAVSCERKAETKEEAAAAASAPGSVTIPAPERSTAAESGAVTEAPAAPATPAAPAAPGAPAFAVLYPGASLDEPAVTASGPAGPGGLVTYTTDADPDAVIAFYRARAEAAGLASVMAMNQGEARAYGAAGTDIGSNLQVVAAPTETGETSVQLSWSAGQ
jgi:hypothetical protein